MIDPKDVALVLLAAGQSSRFGTGNKLEAEFSASRSGSTSPPRWKAFPSPTESW